VEVVFEVLSSFIARIVFRLSRVLCELKGMWMGAEPNCKLIEE